MNEVYLHWYLPDIPGLPRTYTSSISASEWNEDPKNRQAYMKLMREGLVQRIAHDHGERIHPNRIKCAVVDDPDLLWNFGGKA